MRYVITALFCTYTLCGFAQKPFQEGVIVYNVTLSAAGQGEIKGVYTFTIKGDNIKKELKLRNGYEDVLLLDCKMRTAYSLQTKNGKKYAIQLSLSDLENKQKRYAGFIISNERQADKVMGMEARRCNIMYKDSAAVDIYFTKEWSPAQSITFERFPDAKFIPLIFSFTDENGMTVQFNAVRVDAGPVDNAMFRIPDDYKMISYKEYKELSQ